MYLDTLPKGEQEGVEWRGRKLDPELFEKVSPSACENHSRVGQHLINRAILSCIDVRRADRAVIRIDARYQGCLEEPI